MHIGRRLLLVLSIVAMLFAGDTSFAAEPEAAQREFFETRIRPVLIAQCYECHNSTKDADGELALDHRAAMLAGGAGGPILVPGKPAESRLLAVLKHEVKDLEMPQDRAKLAPQIIADFETWIGSGAFDPRDHAPTAEELAQATSSEEAMKQRRSWWSLQPIANPPVPDVRDNSWSEHPVDHFILAKLERQDLAPAPEADKQTLLRRVTFALTGLPPTKAEVEAFLNDASPEAYERVVDRLLASPHFGERWARHWMDVVHYSDTHGYEWDTPAKNAWIYRDYLVRAMNADLPFNQLVMEQLAGDLLPPRVDPITNMNEAILGPMAMRMGERRHGDNAAAEGVTQQAMANIIDTVSKAFLGTTIACSQCHDHKFDAVPQTDYYALAGVLMSSRWSVRCADAVDPNVATIEQLREIKSGIRAELAKTWLASRENLTAKLLAIPAAATAPTASSPMPGNLTELWQRQTTAPIAVAEFKAERERRAAANKANLTLWADFTQADTSLANGWRWEGFGMQHGLVSDGEPVVSLEGDTALSQILPAGRWSHVWSQRLAGVLRSPLFETIPPLTFSTGIAAGKYAARAYIIDNSFHSERLAFLNQPHFGWLTLTAGNFDKLAGGIDNVHRRVYLEISTKGLNNYFPPRTGYGGVSEAEAADPRSWFGVTRIYKHAPGHGPLDELARFESLFATDNSLQAKEQLATSFADAMFAAITRWSENKSNGDDALLISEALTSGWLANDIKQNAELAQLVARYRDTETKLQADRTIGSTDDWQEGQNERLSIRGSYVDFGAEVPREHISLLTCDLTLSSNPSGGQPSGRLELAQQIASNDNPLTSRVIVNRLWLKLFGEGLVRTPDDFGHLGELPTHPELLDWLATRFMQDQWSLKQQIKLLVTSRTWKQSGTTTSAALTKDAENRLWHHMPLRRLDAESIRDSILAISGRLDPQLGGAPIDPHRAAEDAAKRLFSGPLDGAGRRSIYLKMTLMEPPKFLAIFNQPIPKHCTGKRDTTNVPDQALAMLNDPFVVAMAKHWSERLMQDARPTCEARAEQMLYSAFGRKPEPTEIARLVEFTQHCAKLRGGDPSSALSFQPAWQDAAHALFNAKEFVYVD